MTATVTTTLTVLRFIVVGMMAVGLALALALPLPSEMRVRQNTSYVPVTDQRLRDPEPGNLSTDREPRSGLLGCGWCGHRVAAQDE